MTFLQIVRFLASLPIAKLLDFPTDIDDEDSVLTWCCAVVDSVEKFSELTESEIDDTIVETLRNIVEDAATWAAVYSLMKLVWKFFENEELSHSEKIYHAAEAVASFPNDKDVDLNPLVVIGLVNIVLVVIRIWRERR